MEITKARGEAILTLGGKPFKLRPTFTALERVEEALGIGILDLCMRVRRNDIRLKDMSYLIYHFALEGTGPGETVSRQEIGRLLISDGVEQMMKYSAEALICLNAAMTAGNKEVGAASPS